MITLRVREYGTGRLRGTITADGSRAKKLIHFSGSTGWRAWEVLTDTERTECEIEKDCAVRFERIDDAPRE
jgi:hypothetical protein